MVEERILDAVERIDGAMTRIEAAARRVAEQQSAIGGLGDGAAAADDLRERHETMRARVKSAIDELDGLIARG